MLTKSFMINGQTCEGHGHTDKHYIGIFAWNAFTLFLPLKWSLFNSNNSKKCYELEINKETCLSWRQWHQNTKVMAKGFTPFTTYKTILRSRTEDQITSKKFWHCKRVINLASAWVSNGLPKVKHFLQSIRNYIYSRYFVKHFIEALQWHLWLKATCYIQIHGYGSIALIGFVGKPQHETDDPWNKPMFPQILPIHPLRFRHWSNQRNQTSLEPVCKLSFKQVRKNPSLSLYC